MDPDAITRMLGCLSTVLADGGRNDRIITDPRIRVRARSEPPR